MWRLQALGLSWRKQGPGVALEENANIDAGISSPCLPGSQEVPGFLLHTLLSYWTNSHQTHTQWNQAIMDQKPLRGKLTQSLPPFS